MKRVVFILLLVALIFSCDLFNASLDPDYWQKIDDEIAWANAPWVPLFIEAGGMGMATPAGSQMELVKKAPLGESPFVDYSFSLYFQPTRDYPVVEGWQAWYAGEEPFAIWKPGEEVVGEEFVKFIPTNEAATELKIFVYVLPDSGNLIIGPLGAHLIEQSIRVMADSRWGTVFSESMLQRKQGFSFPVEFAANSGSWDFLGWKAYPYDGQTAFDLDPKDLFGNELGDDDVTINVTGIGRATVTVNTDVPVLLVPLCVEQVRVQHSNPPNGSPMAYAPSQDISITFSTQLDPDTVRFEEGFIQMMGQSGESPLDISAHYNPPVYDDSKNVVTITANADDPLTADTAVTVTVGAEVKGRFGNSSTPATINFNVSITSGVTVTNAYRADDVSMLHGADHSQGFIKQWEGYDRDRRIRLNTVTNLYEVTLYFGVRAVGEITNPDTHAINIAEIHYAELNGDEVEGALGKFVTVDGVAAAPGVAGVQGKGSFEYGVMETTTGSAGAEYQSGKSPDYKYYKVVYSWENPLPGIIRLAVLPSGGGVAAETWQTVVASGQGFITVAFDNLAPGGTQTAEFLSAEDNAGAGYATQSGEGASSIYNYNLDNNVMAVNLNFRNIRDNYNDGVISYGNLNATGGKPRTMDPQSAVEWQWRIVTGGAETYIDPEWRNLLNNDAEPVFVINHTFDDALDDNVVREVQVRYRDELGRIYNDGTANTSGWESVGGRVRYYNAPVVAAVTNVNVQFTGGNTIGVTWTMPAGAEGVEVSVNGASPVVYRGSGVQSHTIYSVPYYSNALVREGRPSSVAGYEIRLTAFTAFSRAEVVVNRWNVLELSRENWDALNGVIVITDANKGQLNDAANLGRVFALAEDIEFDGFVPVPGTFTGKVYGNGHTITIRSFGSLSGVADIGLFRIVGGGAVIRDLTVQYSVGGSVGVSPNGEARFGGIAGSTQGTARLESVLVRGAVQLTNNANGTFTINVGGLVGQMSGTSSIYNAYGGLNLSVEKASDTASGSINVGGIAGNTSGGTITEVSVVGDISVGRNEAVNSINSGETSNDGLHVGGLVGLLQDSRLEDADYRQGSIWVSSNNGTARIGGALGRTSGSANVDRCSAFAGEFTVNKTGGGAQFFAAGFVGDFYGGAAVNCSGDNSIEIIMGLGATDEMRAAGFAGRINADISYCYATGDISVTGQGIIYAGGFTGTTFSSASNTISNSYATGNVDIVSLGNSEVYAGGLVGRLYMVLEDCYATGNVTVNKPTLESTGIIYAGGLVAGLTSSLNGRVNRCFATGTVIANRNHSGGITNAGGLVGGETSTNTVANRKRITNSAALGASVTATGGATRNVGRVFGFGYTDYKSNNKAFAGMEFRQSDTYNTDPDSITPTIPSSTEADSKDGADFAEGERNHRDLWGDEEKGGLGFSDDYWSGAWIFTTLASRGYPILRGPMVDWLPGPALGGQ